LTVALSLLKIRSERQVTRNRLVCGAMVEWLIPLAYALGSLVKSRARLEAENLVSRQETGPEVVPKTGGYRAEQDERGAQPSVL